MRRFPLLFFVVLIVPSILCAREPREQQRIDYVIQSLGSLKGAVFIRNGSEYNSKAAQEHLQMKLKYVGERVKTAEQFIQYCASQSSMTHQPYKIRFADGTVTDTSSFFHAKLREFDQKNP